MVLMCLIVYVDISTTRYHWIHSNEVYYMLFSLYFSHAKNVILLCEQIISWFWHCCWRHCKNHCLKPLLLSLLGGCHLHSYRIILKKGSKKEFFYTLFSDQICRLPDSLVGGNERIIVKILAWFLIRPLCTAETYIKSWNFFQTACVWMPS